MYTRIGDALAAALTVAVIGLVTGVTYAGDIEVIFSEAPGHPTAEVPGARDLSGDPVFTEFKAMEVLSVSPDGLYWIIKARNWLGSDLETMLLLGSGNEGEVMAQEGQPIPDGATGELYEFFGSSPPFFNDLNQFVYTARARGGDSSIKQKGMFFDGSAFHIVREESDPALGLQDLPPNPSGDELFGNSFGSMHVLNDGTFGYQDSTIKNIHSSRRPAVFYNGTSFLQSGVTPIATSVWDSLDSNDFWTTPDGTTWIAQGDDEGSTAQDDILVVNNNVVLREGSVIPDTSVTVAAVFHTKLLSMGSWYTRGDDPSDDDWAVCNGTLLAATGDEIVTGSGEHWTDVLRAFTGNSHGAWVLSGETDLADLERDSAIVANGVMVVAREGDPIDLDGNGMFDDDAFIGRGNLTSAAFHADDIFLADNGVLYFFASLRDSAGNDLGSFGTGGDAFLRTALAGDGDFDEDDDVDLWDFAKFQSCFDPEGITEGCTAADLLFSGTVNLDDYIEFVEVLSGP